MGIIRSAFWLAIFFAATFVFTVLFEHGPGDFKANSKKEYDLLKGYISGGPQRKKDDSDKTQ
jgi:hypothetical protein